MSPSALPLPSLGRAGAARAPGAAGSGAASPWAAALAGLFGAATIVVLALIGRAEPVTATAAAAVVAGLGGAIAWRTASARAVGDGGAALPPLAAGPNLTLPFAVAVERLPDPFMVIEAREVDDLAGQRIIYANLAASTLLNIPRAGGALVSAIRNPEVLEALDESLFGGLPRTATLESGGAQQRVWSVWTAPLNEPAEERRLAVLTLRDETEQRRSERMRADFLANASHELRTPLASISGFIETLRGHARDDPGARERFLAIMAGEAERMARLTDDLLSLSRVELNEHVPPSGTCDLTGAVSDTLDALAPVVRERGVSVDLDLPVRALVAGDRDQIVQVVQNLLDNAVKYSAKGGRIAITVLADLSLEAAQAEILGGQPREGGGRMSLLTPDRRPDERFALLRIADQGAGMAREHLPRLAERFYRVEGQKSGPRSGTGLGLAIVKHIVNRHRGGLVVESAPGGGTTFSVYLPSLGETAATKLS